MRSKLPDRGKPTMVAITNQSPMNDTNIELEIPVFQEQRCGATGALERKA